jgi:cation diffusion facilitator family transporter
MSAHSSVKAIAAAAIANLLIAVLKGAAGLWTGSSAMLVEALHSAIDTGNQALLFVGMRDAARPADTRHPFGYGQRLYFWTVIVAVLIFGVGGVTAITEGVHKVLHPEPVTDAWLNYAILGISLVLEGWSWSVAFKALAADSQAGVWRLIRDSKDPVVFAVLFEDSAALAGLTLALAGVAGSQAFGLPWLDGAASVAIGGVLCGTAALVLQQCYGLLTGEVADSAIAEDIRRMAAASRVVQGVNDVRSVHFGPRSVLVAASFDFVDSATAGAVETAIAEMDAQLRRKHPMVSRLYIDIRDRADHQRATRSAIHS